MPIAPSCPVLLVHGDDGYRRTLIKALDERHFSVTYTDDQPAALQVLGEKSFKVIIVAADQARLIEHLRAHPDNGAAVIVVGDAGPAIRALAAVADETLLMPVDPGYVADRARTYC